MSRVCACIWFDVEDYVTPQSDDALLRLARILTEEGVSATFKLVGEKARRLRQRGRSDVIAAVREHDIGYHTDLHSVHPTVSEYLEGLSWEEGIEEFDRRERQGLWDVEEVLDRGCSTYGQPGGAWAPHVYPVLQRWGVPTYVDEAMHVGLHDQPFWYCGVLNALRLRSRFTRMNPDGQNDQFRACAEFDRIAGQLNSEGGGLISICHHECEWATVGFWDGVNFARGANPPLDRLRLPVLRPQADCERDFEAFRQYVRHIADSGVWVVTAADLPALFVDRWAATPVPPDAVFGLAACMADGVNYQPLPYGWASAAEAFAVILTALCTRLDTGRLWLPIPGRYIEGPTSRPPPTRSCAARRAEFVKACHAVRGHLDAHGRVPSEVRVGAHIVSPAAFLRAASRFLLSEMSGALLLVVPIEDTPLECEAEVIEDGAFDWVIFPEGFSAPKLMDLARLQTWTLKPAML